MSEMDPLHLTGRLNIYFKNLLKTLVLSLFTHSRMYINIDWKYIYCVVQKSLWIDLEEKCILKYFLIESFSLDIHILSSG